MRNEILQFTSLAFKDPVNIRASDILCVHESRIPLPWVPEGSSYMVITVARNGVDMTWPVVDTRTEVINKWQLAQQSSE